MTITVSALKIYPLKSARGIEVESMRFDARGPVGDRRWMVVDPDGRFVSQRSDPRLATVTTRWTDGGIEASWDGATVTLLADEDGPGDREVTIWDDATIATDVGDEAAEAFSELLGREVRVVYASRAMGRVADPRRAGPGKAVGFADGYPFLIAQRSSLRDLEVRAGESIAMDRFRPNIVLDGGEPWAEDEWDELVIGSHRFRLVKPCARCTITTLDQRTGEKLGVEPLKTLATFRKWDGGVMFGWNAVGPESGAISVGDACGTVTR